jgi:hypothetical protein
MSARLANGSPPRKPTVTGRITSAVANSRSIAARAVAGPIVAD